MFAVTLHAYSASLGVAGAWAFAELAGWEAGFLTRRVELALLFWDVSCSISCMYLERVESSIYTPYSFSFSAISLVVKPRFSYLEESDKGRG